MLILVTENYAELSARASRIVAASIRKKPELVLGLATGETPRGMYAELVRLHCDEGLDFSNVTTFNLDEYLGLRPDHLQSYHAYMQKELFAQVNVSKERIHIPDGTLESGFESWCEGYEDAIRRAGGIDLQILGIGRDGHIGFNEPTSSLASRTRVKTLTEATREDNRRFFGPEETPPECAITMGIGTILDAKRIILLVSGERKAEALARAVEGPVSASCSASALQMHRRVTTIVDEAAAARLRHIDYYRRVMETTARLTPERAHG